MGFSSMPDYRAARALWKMSKYPREPRVMTQGRFHGTLFGVFAVVTLFGAWTGLTDNGPDAASQHSLGYTSLGIGIIFMSLSAFFVFRKFGVDEEKVWCSFGRYLYREVRFDQIERFASVYQQFRVWDKDKKIKIDINRFDFVFVYLRLIEESHNRRFRIEKVEPTDANWEEKDAEWRMAWKQLILSTHGDYYAAHPDERAYLESLAPDVQPKKW